MRGLLKASGPLSLLVSLAECGTDSSSERVDGGTAASGGSNAAGGTDGKTWTPYQGGAQKFTDGPAAMAFDPANRILYSANWAAGFWALKVLN